jgi:hypothetical protein
MDSSNGCGLSVVKKWFNTGVLREKWFNMWFNFFAGQFQQ